MDPDGSIVKMVSKAHDHARKALVFDTMGNINEAREEYFSAVDSLEVIGRQITDREDCQAIAEIVCSLLTR
jgi:hypothetical protein